MDENKLAAPHGCALVRTEPPKEKDGGVHKPVWVVDEERPDRGVVIDTGSDAGGLKAGDLLAYDHTEATMVGENLWSVPRKAFFCTIDDGKITAI